MSAKFTNSVDDYTEAMSRAWADQSLLERMVTAVQRVRDRLERVTTALEAAGVPYAVAGDNAVSAWVATIDPAAARSAQDIDILFRRDDLDTAERALTAAGFIRCNVAGVEMFIDGPDGRPRDAVHIIFGNERSRPDYASVEPDVTDAARPVTFNVVAIEPIVRMKLTSFRRKDQMHLRDMLDVGLIDATWPARYPPVLAARLQMLIDTPEG